MVQTCCVKNCKSERERNGDISFHRFPKNPEHFAKFVAEIPPNFVAKITKHSTICSKHFTVDSYMPTSSVNVNRRLKNEAIPTLFDYDFKCSMINNPTSVVKAEPNIGDADNQMEVQSVQCAPAIKAALCKERTSNDLTSHTKTLQSGPSTTRTQEIDVQTLGHYMLLCNKVSKLQKEVRMLRKRLQRRDIRVQTMGDVITHLKRNGKCTDEVENVLRECFSGFSLEMLRNEYKNSCVIASRRRYSEDINP